MKARKIVATAVLGISVLGGAPGAGAQAADLEQVVGSITSTVDGTLAGLGLSVPATPSVPQAPALPPVPDTSGVQVTAEGVKVSVGGHGAQVDVPAAPALPGLPSAPATPSLPATPSVTDLVPGDVPRTDPALLRIWIIQAAEEVRASSTSTTRDGHDGVTTTTGSGVKMFAAGLEVAGLGPVSLAVTDAWATASATEAAYSGQIEREAAAAEGRLGEHLP